MTRTFSYTLYVNVLQMRNNIKMNIQYCTWIFLIYCPWNGNEMEGFLTASKIIFSTKGKIILQQQGRHIFSMIIVVYFVPYFLKKNVHALRHKQARRCFSIIFKACFQYSQWNAVFLYIFMCLSLTSSFFIFSYWLEGV